MWDDAAALARSRALDAVSSALQQAGLGGQAEGEALLKQSTGCSLRMRHGATPERSHWSERGLAVRIVCNDGRCALVAASHWGTPELVAREAVARALSAAPCAGPLAPLASAPPQEMSAAAPDWTQRRGFSGDDLAAALGALEAAAHEQDQRVISVDRATLRAALVDSMLVTTLGAESWQRQPLVHAQASVLAREGLRVSCASNSCAGSSLAGLPGLGVRLGRAALLDLLGVRTTPESPQLLFSAVAVAELTHALAPALLGLTAAAPAPSLAGVAIHEELRLAEDAFDDQAARRLPLDGAGLPLQELVLVEAGRSVVPEREALPHVRASLAGLPERAWQRLSWGFGDGASSLEALQAQLGTGLLIDELQLLSLSATGRLWRGLAAGRWLESGQPHHAVSGFPLEVELSDFLGRIIAGGDEPLSVHSSGSVRAIPLLLSAP